MNAEKDYSAGELFGISNEVTLVTGASGQLGAEIVNGLTANGARVIATDLSLVGLKQAAKVHKWSEECASLHECDIRDSHVVEEAITAGISRHGEVTIIDSECWRKCI